MPRQPSRAARFGTRFHLWVERYFGGRLPSGALGQQQLVDPDELTDRADVGQPRRAGAARAVRGLRGRRFGSSVPYAIEAPFTFAGRRPADPRPHRRRLRAARRRRTRGRASRSSTGRRAPARRADPLQLAIYRLAWAEAQQIPAEQVDAVFYYVRSDRLVRPERLPDRDELEPLLNGEDRGPTTGIRLTG